MRKYIGSRKYVAASRKITIVHTIEHLLAHFDLHSNIGWFITRIVSTGCSTIIECNYVSSSFRVAREWNVLLLSDNTQFQKLLVILKIIMNINYVEIFLGNRQTKVKDSIFYVCFAHLRFWIMEFRLSVYQKYISKIN